MPESTLRGILKKKGLLLAEAEKGGRMKSRKNIREGRHAELDDNKQRLLKVMMMMISRKIFHALMQLLPSNQSENLPRRTILAMMLLPCGTLRENYLSRKPVTPNKPKLIHFLIIHSHTCKYSKMQNLVGFIIYFIFSMLVRVVQTMSKCQIVEQLLLARIRFQRVFVRLPTPRAKSRHVLYLKLIKK